MREIKFKFYCDESCTMSKIFTIEELANGRYDFHCDINKAIKLQYTGLKDKNGKEIYEGDILKGKCILSKEERRFIGEIKYIGHSFKAVGIRKWKGLHIEFNSLFEVVGNIYENPELIEDTK